MVSNADPRSVLGLNLIRAPNLSFRDVDPYGGTSNEVLEIRSDLLSTKYEEITQCVWGCTSRVHLLQIEIQRIRPVGKAQLCFSELMNFLEEAFEWLITLDNIEVILQQHAVSELVDGRGQLLRGHWRGTFAGRYRLVTLELLLPEIPGNDMVHLEARLAA